MRILITGGAGFIGSNIAEALVDKHDVVVLDNFFLGSKDNLPKGVDLVEGDVLDEKTVSKAAKGADIVFHEAAASSSPMFMDDLKTAVSVNVIIGRVSDTKKGNLDATICAMFKLLNTVSQSISTSKMRIMFRERPVETCGSIFRWWGGVFPPPFVEGSTTGISGRFSSTVSIGVSALLTT